MEARLRPDKAVGRGTALGVSSRGDGVDLPLNRALGHPLSLGLMFVSHGPLPDGHQQVVTPGSSTLAQAVVRARGSFGGGPPTEVPEPVRGGGRGISGSASPVVTSAVAAAEDVGQPPVGLKALGLSVLVGLFPSPSPPSRCTSTCWLPM